uniref:Uncharacterized protein n=1 Tax=Anguilla anguilla TaxID=7936 RepID=A0A0E9WWM7_ANGAN
MDCLVLISPAGGSKTLWIAETKTSAVQRCIRSPMLMRTVPGMVGAVDVVSGAIQHLQAPPRALEHHGDGAEVGVFPTAHLPLFHRLPVHWGVVQEAQRGAILLLPYHAVFAKKDVWSHTQAELQHS